VEIIVQ